MVDDWKQRRRKIDSVHPYIEITLISYLPNSFDSGILSNILDIIAKIKLSNEFRRYSPLRDFSVLSRGRRRILIISWLI